MIWSKQSKRVGLIYSCSLKFTCSVQRLFQIRREKYEHFRDYCGLFFQQLYHQTPGQCSTARFQREKNK